MSRTNETRHITFHETCKCKCKLDGSVCNNKQRQNEVKCRCECKELIDKCMCVVKDLFGVQLIVSVNVTNCKCRKKLVDNLVEECTETVEEMKLAKITLAVYENICKFSCIVNVVFLSIIFTINAGIGTYFIYY